MKLRILALAALVLSGATMDAANWTVLRRITQIAGCAASGADAATTLRGGLRETNPLLANRDGTPNAVRLIGIKAGTCAVSIAVAEIRHRQGRSEKLAAISGAVTAGVYSGISAHNAGLK